MEKLFANITVIAICSYIYVQQSLIQWAEKQVIAQIMESNLMTNYDIDEEFEARLAELTLDYTPEDQYEIGLIHSDDIVSEDNSPDTSPNIIQQLLDEHFANIDNQ